MLPSTGSRMTPSLENRTAFVTGTARGLGLAIARELYERGMQVVMADVDGEANRAAAGELDPRGERTEPVDLDVAQPGDAVSAVDSAVDRWGSLDLLVNNAAITGGTSLWDLTIGEWDEVLAVNLRSVFVLSRAAGARMRDKGIGRIVNISSLAGQAARPSGAAYAASKAGIIALTRVFALELAPYGVTVNAIAPGVIDTPMVRSVGPDVLERLIAGVPVGRIAEPGEIAAVVAFLASEEAGFITGATYDVNGGTLMR